MSFDKKKKGEVMFSVKSQSLWNRAMSFDNQLVAKQWEQKVSIPLEQGNVFRQRFSPSENFLPSLNPFGTGQCLSTYILTTQRHFRSGLNPFGTGQCLSTKAKLLSLHAQASLNPFGTGQCLSTKKEDQVIRELKVSIPLEQGNVFRQ